VLDLSKVALLVATASGAAAAPFAVAAAASSLLGGPSSSATSCSTLQYTQGEMECDVQSAQRIGRCGQNAPYKQCQQM
jgi:hypothetical protein